MKLPDATLDLEAQLLEFDHWVTPSLAEIRDAEKYQDELERIASILETIGGATDEFHDAACTTPEALATTVSSLLETLDDGAGSALLVELGALLFLVTGKSNNNLKCQLPLYLRDHAQWEDWPVAKVRRGAVSVVRAPVPRVLKMEAYMQNVALLREEPELRTRLLRTYLDFVLDDADYQAQLWSIGRSYFRLRATGQEKHLLAPLVVFKVRGSVSASGGHDPEQLLRERLEEWGLRPGVDFNLADVVVAEEAPTGRRGKKKTRAYDFVLPYETPGCEPRLHVQCQFYAGDAGSVSHKNVDQTSSSRAAVLAEHADALFLEYVDGAGYFSSLNKDLKSLLGMETTSSFFQVRSAPVRLRRALQGVGFLTPLDVAHAVLDSDGSPAGVRARLAEDGYDDREVERAIETAIDLAFLTPAQDGELGVTEERRATCRRYALLDVVASAGATFGEEGDVPPGCVLVPGYGAFHGMPLDDLGPAASERAPGLRDDWNVPDTLLEDVLWLAERGFVVRT